MNIRTTLLALVAVLGASSCGDTYIPRESATLHFRPRVCTQMFTLPLEDVEVVEDVLGKVYRRHEYVRIKGKAVEASKFHLWMMTGADDLKDTRLDYPEMEALTYQDQYDLDHPGRKKAPLLAPSIPQLEGQLRDDFRKWASGSRGLASGSKGVDAVARKTWPYRVTGVKDFRIISLSPLFGQPAESSLNDYFIIDEFRPRQVISYRRKALLWGYSDKDKVTNIRQWLSMEPMAPPMVMFRFKSRPEELPIKTKLVSILETTEGKELRDTLEVELR